VSEVTGLKDYGMADNIILLVEDNADDEALTLRALRKDNIGNKVVVVRDGVEALDFLFCTGDYADRDPNNLPEVVLMDLRLPKVDGLELLRLIRAVKRTSLLPVVILTSSNADQDLVAGYEYGANSYIRKPVDFTQLIQAIRQLGLHLLVLNEAPHL
jgi:two-component system response regulator